ncbi:MAG: tRNA 2-selenouridine(34) synthase MnmH [Betaproteobacteria bacterium]
MRASLAGLDEIGGFDEIIDVRSPAEYADDHIPGAINCPVLDNEQRAQVGTLYVQVSPFEAKKIGAALVAENIARHLRERFLDRPKNWRPLIYCWRGGNRSGAMVTIFRAIGWRAFQLEGGYKTYRRGVMDELLTLPRKFSFSVLCGPTGSAKTAILQAIGALGEQILDLESLARHKGSVLGVLPDVPQPGQKALESALHEQLLAFDPGRPLYVEAESRKIGRLRLPDALLETMRNGECITIEAEPAARVEFLLRDYGYFLTDPERLKGHLQGLAGLHSRETLTAWNAWIDAGCWRELVADLLEKHYDPQYRRSQDRHYAGLSRPHEIKTEALDPESIFRIAQTIVRLSPHPAP